VLSRLVKGGLKWFKRRRNGLSLDQQLMLLKVVTQFIEAGLSSREAIEVLGEDGDRKMRRLIHRLSKKLSGGATLSCALKQADCGFDSVALALMKVGEDIGDNRSALNSAQKHLERTRLFKNQITAALRYPSLVLVALCLSLYCLKIFLLPHILALTSMRAGAGAWATKSLMWVLTGEAPELWLVMFMALLTVASVMGVRVSRRGRFFWHRFLLRCPLTAPLILAGRWSCFFNLMALSLRTSLTLPSALSLSEGVLDYAPLLQHVSRTRKAVFEGQSLSVSLHHAPGFLPEARQMLCAGERSGNLSVMCEHIAGIYEDRLKHYQEAAQTYVGPLMLFVLALLFMWIIQGAVLPLYDHLGDITGGGLL
jgi:MSHA biogenesis protein MshG